MSKSELVTIITNDINNLEKITDLWRIPQEKVYRISAKVKLLKDILKYVELLDSLE